MTDNSADAIVPLSLHKDYQRTLSIDSTRTISDMESSFSDQDDDLLDSFFNGACMNRFPVVSMYISLMDSIDRLS
jgi:hypothetical protein